MQVTHRKNDGIDIRGLEEDNHANDEDNYDLKVNLDIHGHLCSFGLLCNNLHILVTKAELKQWTLPLFVAYLSTLLTFNFH